MATRISRAAYAWDELPAHLRAMESQLSLSMGHHRGMLLTERILDVRGLSPRVAALAVGVGYVAFVAAALFACNLIPYRAAHLVATLTREELLGLDADTVLRRLFWEEPLLRHEPRHPRFACSCARERVRNMLRGLGADEVQGIIAERGEVEVGCEFCGQQYRFDAVDVGEMFTPVRDQPHTPSRMQ